MSRLVFDIEGNGLLFHVTEVWCMATQDADTGEKHRYPYDRVAEGIAALRDADVLVGHNIIGYDIPALWKVHGEWDSYPLIIDTLLVSRFLHPERYGGHGLAAWGERLGVPKLDFDDFEGGYTEEMMTYCEGDVTLNTLVLEELEREYGEKLEGFKVW